jgi:4-azaleucine resistance transporter AzlC
MKQPACCADIDSPLAHDSSCAVEFRRGFIATIPIMIGFIPVALVLGIQAVQKGFHIFEVPMMTALNFGGGSEFAAIEIWTSPPHLFLVAITTLMVNSRHLLMGATFSTHLRHLPKRRVLPALFFMCDESWALSLADTHQRARAGLRIAFSLAFYWGAAAGLYLTWSIAATVGAYVGPTLGDISVYGFDMAFPAIFLVLLRGMWKGFRASRPWLVSLAVAALTYVIAPGLHVPLGAIAGLLAAYFWSTDNEPEELCKPVP